MRDRRGPWGPEFHHFHERGHEWFPVLFLGLLAILVVIAVVMLVRSGRVPHSASPAAMAPEPALQELRLRYARGEISREEYLQRAADLGDRGTSPPPPPAAPPSEPSTS